MLRPGQQVHVVFRTCNRAFLFNAIDQFRFLKEVFEHGERFGMQIFAWTGMTNHQHLFLQTPMHWHTETAFARRQIQLGEPATLGDFMRECFSDYARTLNIVKNRDGAVIKDRTRTVPVFGDRHALALLIYIFFNPVRAGLVEDPRRYPFSNYAAYLDISGASDFQKFSLHPAYLRLDPRSLERVAKFRYLMEAARKDWALQRWEGASAGSRVGHNRRHADEKRFIDFTCEWFEKTLPITDRPPSIETLDR